MLLASSAVSVTPVTGVPAVAVEPTPPTTNSETFPALTVVLADPVIDPCVAVSVCEPAPVKVTPSEVVLAPELKLTVPTGRVGAVSFGLLAGPDQVIDLLPL